MENKLSNILNFFGVIELICLVIFIIIRIWTEQPILLNKLILSDVILFLGTFFFYWIFCYEPKDKQE